MIFKCAACHDFFRSEEGLTKHFAKNCKNVFFTGLTKDELYPYLIDPSKMKYDKNILYTIQQNYQFDNVEEFSMIIKVLHMFIQNKKNEKNMEELFKEEKINCPFCYKNFSTNSNLFKHIKKNVCTKQKEKEKVEDYIDGRKWEDLSEMINSMKIVILNLGDECTFEDVFKDDRMELFRKEDGYSSTDHHLFAFLKRNPFFTFEVSNSDLYEDNPILKKPTVYMYYHKNLKSTSNSFDECFEMRHINSDYLYLLQKDSMFLFIEKYLELSKNINIYVESIKGMKAIIHYRKIILEEDEVKKDVLFRPTNILYVFKNWIQSVYFLIMDIIRHYVFESPRYEHKYRVEVYKLLRRNLQQQYADVMDNMNNFKIYVKKILKLFKDRQKVCKSNFFREVSDHRIYTGEIIIVNKVLDDISQREEYKLNEKKDRDLGLLKKYNIESSDLISSKDIIQMGKDILDKIETEKETEDEVSQSTESGSMVDEEEED